MRTLLTLSLCGLLVQGAWSAQADQARRDMQGQVPNKAASYKATGAEEIPPVKAPSHSPMATDLVGETVQVGTTTYDYQANGTLSKMVAVSADGVAHGTFMYSAAMDLTWADRRVKAWCVNPDLSVVDALNVHNSRAGYTTAAATSANPVNGLPANSTVAAFHTGSPADSWFGVDFFGCTHAFDLLQYGSTNFLWPHVALNGDDKVHMVVYDSATSSDNVWYRGSTSGTSWDAPTILLTNQSAALGSIPVGSKTSSRTAVLYHHKTGTDDIPYDMGSGFIGIQIHHDIRGYVANDGDIYAQHSAANEINFTSFGPASMAPFGPYGSRAYCDVDGLFDHTEDTEFHIAYTGGPQWTDTLHVIWDEAAEDSLTEVYMHWNLGRGQIWHHNYDTGTWGHIWGSNCLVDPTDVSWVDAGAWRQRNDHPSLAVDPSTGYLYCAWNQYSADDMGPVDAAGDSYPNGEIYISCSADNGLTWGQPVNVTETPSPDCVSGECLSESWHSLAEIVDGHLHLTYVLDRCPGGIPQEECFSTLNPVIYHRIPVAEIPPHAGTPWNAAGRVGLAQTKRWYRWYAAAWCGEGSVLDSVKWIDPVHVFNEAPFDVQLDRISWHHNMLDQIGPPEALGITEVGVTVKTPDGYVPLEGWNGLLPSWRGTKFNVHFAYSGLTNSDVLIGFHFTDDRPSLYYRLDMENALQGEPEPCTGVIPIPIENIAQFEETVLHQFSSLGDPWRPIQFNLEQNVPNPFNPATTIRYSLEAGAPVVLKVHNLAGQLVHERQVGFQGAGWHQLSFDGSQLASGVYLYTIEAGLQTMTRKMLLAK
ncbi:MAG: T9SS type A sorting domain-containing protein [bacterium]|nr:T9SS type A sorting domain-containing protein [bacterium]